MVSTVFATTASPASSGSAAEPIGSVDTAEPAKVSRLAYSWQNLLTSVPLAISDLISVWAACLIAYLVVGLAHSPQVVALRPLLLSSSLAMLVAFVLLELYPACGISPAVEFRQVTTGILLVGLGCILANLSQHATPTWTLICFGIWGAAAAVIIPMARTTTRSWCSRFDWWRQPVLIVGPAGFCHEVAQSVQRDRRAGLRPIPILMNEEAPGASSAREAVERLATLARQHNAFRAILASSAAAVEGAADGGSPIPHLHVVNHGSAAPLLWGRTSDRDGYAELEMQNRLLVPSSAYCKRAMDLCVIALALPFLLPLFLFLSIMVKLSSPGPIFYSQRRLGRGARFFNAWKFRTMVVNADAALAQYLRDNPELQEEWERDHKLKRDPRVTTIGRFLRKTSLDELPQLWNVLRGEMSLVGPRPIVSDEIPKYGTVFEVYKRVRPGITGMWQISGRNNTTYDERLKFDRYYVRNWSPWLDAFILFRTVKTVLLREGAY